jgi:hypothetical protein
MRWIFGSLVESINKLTAELRRQSMWLRRPQRLRVRLIRQENDMALVYAVSAAAPVDSDVVERRLTIEVDGVVEMRTLPPSATELGEIKVARDAEVLLALVDADGSGNVSEPATFEFVAVDTIPPAKPGEFGVSLLRQED